MSHAPGPGWLAALRRRLAPGSIPAPAQSHPLLSDGLDTGSLGERLTHVLALPYDPPVMHDLGGGNGQVGAQPERAHAVLRGFSVSGPYLLSGDLPTPPLPIPRLTQSLEALFTPHPLQIPRWPIPLGPVGGMMPVRPE